jgi:phage tail-like protein
MADRRDPYLQTRFVLEIDGLATAGFSRCHLPTSSSAVVEYREGTDPPTPRKLPGLTEYGPLVLETGVTDRSVELFQWRKLVGQGRVDEARRDVAVTLLDAAGHPAARWVFDEAWPSQYEAPRLDASRSAVAVERLVVVHEGFERDVVERGDDESEPDERSRIENPPKSGTPRLGERPRTFERPQGLQRDRDEA